MISQMGTHGCTKYLLMILVARHGETEWNSVGRMQGQQNSPLTDDGLEQAYKLAQAVDQYDMDQIISSPLGRATETSNIVAEQTGLSMKTDDRLREIDIGAYSGLTKNEVNNRNPGFFEQREANKWKCRWPEGESYADASLRAAEFIQAEDDLDGTIIVAHRSFNRVLLGELLELSPSEILDIEQSNDAVFEVFLDQSYQKRRYNEIISD